MNNFEYLPEDVVIEIENDKGKVMKLNKEQFVKLINEKKLSISSNGVVYKTEHRGLIPSILEAWFDERLEFKRLQKEAANKKDKESEEYFDKRQLVQKILLNSVYGVVGSPSFRFFDIDNASAVTTTGQDVTKFSGYMINQYYTKRTKEDKDVVIYSDTDSCYISAIPLVEDINNKAPDKIKGNVIQIADEVCIYINDCLKSFTTYHLNSPNNRLKFAQEVMASAGIWIAKKRYALLKSYELDTGRHVDEISVKGMDVVRSDFPAAFRKFASTILEDILRGVGRDEIDKKILEFKKSIKTLPIVDIANPTGVKGIKKYSGSKINGIFTEKKKRTPAHVGSAINYNDMLIYFKVDTQYKPIIDHDKIKWVYLKENPLKLRYIAFRGYDDAPEVEDYIKQYIDYNKVFESSLKNKLNDLYQALGWGILNTNITKEKFNKFFG